MIELIHSITSKEQLMYNFQNLDDLTRTLMIAEIESDIEKGGLYTSRYLTETGAKQWGQLLISAVGDGGPKWLIRELSRGRMKRSATYERQGRTITKTIVLWDAENLACSEFNRFYMRALCKRAILEGTQLTVYRAKSVSTPRADSYSLIGTIVEPFSMYEGLLNFENAQRPFAPGSGLSLRIIETETVSNNQTA